MKEEKTSQDEFNELVKKWKDIGYTSPDERSNASTFYDNHIFPKVKELFIKNPKNHPNKKYDGLILPVGYSPAPLILSILAIKPKRVGLLYTEETEKFLPRIQSETKLTLTQLAMHKIDGSSTLDVYEVIMELYKKWERPTNIAVDITGGKKSMVGGAAMAGAVLNADIYYVDNTKFTQMGKPEPGSEYLSLLDNPYTVFGDLEVEKAKNLYNRHDYAGAHRIFAHLKSIVRDANKAKTYEAYEYLCTAYEAWDNLNIGQAKHFIEEKLLDILDQFPTLEGLITLKDKISSFNKQTEALKILQTLLKNEKLSLDVSSGFHFAFMIYHNALRREAQGKHDTAGLILYRLLEWIEQHRLAQYSIDTRKPNYSEIDAECIFDRYAEKSEEVFQRKDKSTLPSPIGVVDGYLLLYALQDDIVEDIDWGKFRNQVETRNQSIYAHGMQMIDNKKFKYFKKTVEEIFVKTQELAGIDADEFNEQHRFIELLL